MNNSNTLDHRFGDHCIYCNICCVMEGVGCLFCDPHDGSSISALMERRKKGWMAREVEDTGSAGEEVELRWRAVGWRVGMGGDC